MFLRKRNPDYRAANSHFNFVKEGEEMMVVCHESVFAGQTPDAAFKLESEETYIARLHKDNIADNLDAFRAAIAKLANPAITDALDDFVQKFQTSYKPS